MRFLHRALVLSMIILVDCCCLTHAFQADSFLSSQVARHHPFCTSRTALGSSRAVGATAAVLSYASPSIVLWSETAVILSGCGPVELSDAFERTSYWLVLIVAGCCWFCRIAFSQSMGTVLDLDPSTTKLVQVAEMISYISVLGAVLALLSQAIQGTQMDGLSGIDIEYCRALQSI
jgi:hypothetical protein